VRWSSHISIIITLYSQIEFSFETKTENRSLAGPYMRTPLGTKAAVMSMKNKPECKRNIKPEQKLRSNWWIRGQGTEAGREAKRNTPEQSSNECAI